MCLIKRLSIFVYLACFNVFTQWAGTIIFLVLRPWDFNVFCCSLSARVWLLALTQMKLSRPHCPWVCILPTDVPPLPRQAISWTAIQVSLSFLCFSSSHACKYLAFQNAGLIIFHLSFAFGLMYPWEKVGLKVLLSETLQIFWVW